MKTQTKISRVGLLGLPWPHPYSADRARRTLRGIDEQVRKANNAVAGKAPVTRNRFIALDGATRSVNRDLEAKARALAGITGDTTNITNPTPESDRLLRRVVAHQQVVSHVQPRPARPTDLPPQTRVDRRAPDHGVRRARPPRLIEARTGWSIKNFVQTARRYRTVQIRAGNQFLTAADPIPAQLRETLAQII